MRRRTFFKLMMGLGGAVSLPFFYKRGADWYYSKQSSSPNHRSRGFFTPIDMIVLHSTDTIKEEAVLSELHNPNSHKSAHYLVKLDGTVIALVAEEHAAWHAGEAFWRGHKNINQRSIGIEIVNKEGEAFTNDQMRAVVRLVRRIMRDRDISLRNIVAHSDVAPTRRRDPGVKFSWKRMANNKLSLWPKTIKLRRRPTLGEAQYLLRFFGYDVEITHVEDTKTISALRAFQRRFRPSHINGFLDGETGRRLISLVHQIDAGKVAALITE